MYLIKIFLLTFYLVQCFHQTEISRFSFYACIGRKKKQGEESQLGFITYVSHTIISRGVEHTDHNFFAVFLLTAASIRKPFFSKLKESEAKTLWWQ